MKSNEELQHDVQNAIKWEPLLNAAEIGVIAKNGIVTLTGVVNSYTKKMEAENAAKGVTGVVGIAEKITIDYGYSPVRDDTQIASDIVSSWKWKWDELADSIKVNVEAGQVKLTGEVAWNYQREDIKAAVAQVQGVKGIEDEIVIKSRSIDRLEREAIEHALTRSWTINAQNIKVEVKGDLVKLTGTVGSMYQKDEAGRLSWNAPGVVMVDNQLVVQY